MYKVFIVKNFRGFEEIKINGLSKINLITGKNNVGKTALLEALFIHIGAYNPQLTIRVNAFRGFTEIKFELSPWAESPWESIFNNFDKSKVIELIGEFENGQEFLIKMKELQSTSEFKRLQRVTFPSKNIKGSFEIPQIVKAFEFKYETLSSQKGGKGHQKISGGESYIVVTNEGTTISPTPPPPFPGFFLFGREIIRLQEDADRFGRMEKAGNLESLVEILKILEPRLEKLSVILQNGIPTIHGFIGGQPHPIPIPLMGEGMSRLTSIVLAIANAQNGVVLIDEIENGIHYSKLQQLWTAISKIANQLNVQLFVTTHSYECIESAYYSLRETHLEDFRMFRLDRENDSVKVTSYDIRSLESSIKGGLEVR